MNDGTTSETDRAERVMLDGAWPEKIVRSDFARKLECERDQARAELSAIAKAVNFAEGVPYQAPLSERVKAAVEHAEQLKAELAELRKDKERLDWLEETSPFDADDIHYRWIRFKWFYFAKSLRQAIDTAKENA